MQVLLLVRDVCTAALCVRAWLPTTKDAVLTRKLHRKVTYAQRYVSPYLLGATHAGTTLAGHRLVTVTGRLL